MAFIFLEFGARTWQFPPFGIALDGSRVRYTPAPWILTGRNLKSPRARVVSVVRIGWESLIGRQHLGDAERSSLGSLHKILRPSQAILPYGKEGCQLNHGRSRRKQQSVQKIDKGPMKLLGAWHLPLSSPHNMRPSYLLKIISHSIHSTFDGSAHERLSSCPPRGSTRMNPGTALLGVISPACVLPVQQHNKRHQGR